MSLYDFSVSSGTSIVPQSSGNSDLGSTGSYFNYVYANNLVVGTGGSGGPFVLVAGDSMTDDLTMTDPASIKTNWIVPANPTANIHIGSGSSNLYLETNGTSNPYIKIASGGPSEFYGGGVGLNLITSATIGTSGNIFPIRTNVDSLGYSARKFADVYTTNVSTDTVNSPAGFTHNVSGGNYVLNNVGGSTTLYSPSGSMSFQVPNNGMTFNASGTVNFNNAGSINFNASNDGAGDISLSASSRLTLTAASGVVTYNNIFPNTSGTLSLGTTTSPFSGVFASPIIKSPNGQQWMITVDNAGVLSAVSYP